MTTTSKVEMTVLRADVDRLREIQEEMLDLLGEARSLVQRAGMDSGQRVIFERARAYWLAQVAMGLSNDHEYLGGATCSLSDTLSELEALVGDDSEEDDETDEEYHERTGEPRGAGEDVFERQMMAKYPEIRR
jgi:hypothetical protein